MDLFIVVEKNAIREREDVNWKSDFAHSEIQLNTTPTKAVEHSAEELLIEGVIFIVKAQVMDTSLGQIHEFIFLLFCSLKNDNLD